MIEFCRLLVVYVYVSALCGVVNDRVAVGVGHAGRRVDRGRARSGAHSGSGRRSYT